MEYILMFISSITFIITFFAGLEAIKKDNRLWIIWGVLAGIAFAYFVLIALQNISIVR